MDTDATSLSSTRGRLKPAVALIIDGYNSSVSRAAPVFTKKRVTPVFIRMSHVGDVNEVVSRCFGDHLVQDGARGGMLSPRGG